MTAGTNTIRTSVASTTTASARPTPIILMKATWPLLSAANTITINSAAAVMTRPAPAMPSATASALSSLRWGDASQCSRIRDNRNTS